MYPRFNLSLNYLTNLIIITIIAINLKSAATNNSPFKHLVPTTNLSHLNPPAKINSFYLTFKIYFSAKFVTSDANFYFKESHEYLHSNLIPKSTELNFILLTLQNFDTRFLFVKNFVFYLKIHPLFKPLFSNRFSFFF